MAVNPSQRRHPNPDGVRTLVDELLAESRKVSGWRVNVLDFDFFRQGYRIKLVLNGDNVEIELPSEWVTDCWMSDERGPRRRIKRMLKDAVKSFAELEE